jgi:hypothetical protein
VGSDARGDGIVEMEIGSGLSFTTTAVAGDGDGFSNAEIMASSASTMGTRLFLGCNIARSIASCLGAWRGIRMSIF